VKLNTAPVHLFRPGEANDWRLENLSSSQVFGELSLRRRKIVSNNYWSSTENSSTNAWNMNFNNDNANNNAKSNSRYVRCVRGYSISSQSPSGLRNIFNGVILAKVRIHVSRFWVKPRMTLTKI